MSLDRPRESSSLPIQHNISSRSATLEDIAGFHLSGKMVHRVFLQKVERFCSDTALGIAVDRCRTRHQFNMSCQMKTKIVPRQARDKHKSPAGKRGRFSRTTRGVGLRLRGRQAPRERERAAKCPLLNRGQAQGLRDVLRRTFASLSVCAWK